MTIEQCPAKIGHALEWRLPKHSLSLSQLIRAWLAGKNLEVSQLGRLGQVFVLPVSNRCIGSYGPTRAASWVVLPLSIINACRIEGVCSLNSPRPSRDG